MWNSKAHGIVVSFSCYFILPALHAAALSGHVSTVKLLLEHKAQVDALDVMKHTPLFRACEMGHKEVIQTLIKGQLLILHKPVQSSGAASYGNGK